MIRLAIFCGVVLVLTGCKGEAKKDDKKDEKKDEKAEMARFQGKWKVVKGVARGTPVPEKELAEAPPYIFTGDKLTITDRKETDASMTFKIDPTQEIARIDLQEPGTQDPPVAGIYKFDGPNQLVLCLNKGFSTTPPTAFESKPGSPVLLLVLEKVKE